METRLKVPLRSFSFEMILRAVLLIAIPLLANAADIWDVTALAKPPKTHEVKTTEPGVRAIFFESVPWKGKSTRVFAYYGVPAGKNIPAMVLIHGGGGTAFAEWVRMWNKRGYAAIAMDTNGTQPETASADKLWNPVRNRHEHSGPSGWGGFAQIEEPITDQWSYHAVAAVISAHSLIRSFPEIDSKKIGVTGISWGGYLTNIVAGVDDRFSFAAPVYGCGFLGEDSTWLKDFEKMGPENAKKWLSHWDPSVHLPHAKIPMLWVTGTNDFAYPMGSLQKSYRLPKGKRTLAVRVAMKHSHPDGAIPEEIFAFADSMVKSRSPLPQITDVQQGKLKFRTSRKIEKAELNYTIDLGKWQDRKWQTVPARLDAKTKTVSADISAEATVWYLNIFDENGLVVSSEHEYRNTDPANP